MRKWRSCSPRPRCCTTAPPCPRKRRCSPCNPYDCCKPCCQPTTRRCHSYSPRRRLRCFDPLSPCSPCCSPDSCDPCNSDCTPPCGRYFPRRCSPCSPRRYTGCYSRKCNPCDPCYPLSCDPCFPSKCDPCGLDDCDPCNPCYRYDCDRCCDPCYPIKHDPCFPRKYRSCFPKKYSCSIRSIDSCDPCSPLKCDPCSPLKCDPCSPLRCDPCNPLRCDPCNPLRCDSFIPRKPCRSPTRTFCLYRNGDPCSPCTDLTPGKSSVLSEPLSCDTFSKVCYPCDMSTRRLSWRRSPYCDPCDPNYSSNKSRSTSRLCKWDPCTLSYKNDLKGPCEVKCSSGNDCPDDGPSFDFLRKSRSLGKNKNRFEPHFCPWEADVTVSGAIRGHCTSTAVEVARKLTGRFKSSGDRYTTDSQAKDAPCNDERQKMSLGCLDDGTRLDLSRNNRFSTDEDEINNHAANLNKNKATDEPEDNISQLDDPSVEEFNPSLADTEVNTILKNSSRDEKNSKQIEHNQVRCCRRLEMQHNFPKHKSASDSAIQPEHIRLNRLNSKNNDYSWRHECPHHDERSTHSNEVLLDRDIKRFLNQRRRNRYLTRPELSSPGLMEDECRSSVRMNASPISSGRKFTFGSPREHFRQLNVQESSCKRPQDQMFSLSSTSEDDLDKHSYDREDCSPRTERSDFYCHRSEVPPETSKYQITPMSTTGTDYTKSCLSKGTRGDGALRFRSKRVSYDDEQ